MRVFTVMSVMTDLNKSADFKLHTMFENSVAEKPISKPLTKKFIKLSANGCYQDKLQVSS